MANGDDQFTNVRPIDDEFANVRSLSSDTVPIGGAQVNLRTGEGAGEAALGQSLRVPQEAGRQMHGAVSLIGRPEASQAADEGFEKQFGGGDFAKPHLGTFLGGHPLEVPPGSEYGAYWDERVPYLANIEGVAGMPEAIGQGLARSLRVGPGNVNMGELRGVSKLLPWKMGQDALDMLVPERADVPVRGSAYEQRAQDLMQRGTEQEGLDRKAATEARRSPENTKLFKGSASKVDEAEYQRTKEITEAQEAAKAAQAARLGKPGLTLNPEGGTATNSPNLTPFRPNLDTGLTPPAATTSTGPPVKIVTGKEPPVPKSRLIEPGGPERPVKITGQSWSRDNLIRGIRDSRTPYQTRVLMAKDLYRNLGDKDFPDEFRYLIDVQAPAQAWRDPKK